MWGERLKNSGNSPIAGGKRGGVLGRKLKNSGNSPIIKWIDSCDLGKKAIIYKYPPRSSEKGRATCVM